MTLADVRVNIDRVDGQLKELFIERMGLSEEIVRVKAQTGDSILKKDRELAIVERLTADVDEKIKEEYTAFIRRLMEVSRKYQYGRMLELSGADLKELTKSFIDYSIFEVEFSVPDEPRALAQILMMIADYGVNVTKLEKVKEETLENCCRFTVNFHADIPAEKKCAMFYQLGCETMNFKILGCMK